ncbi:hypothetical protein M9H77_30061 [Catharanthus roseus]|uniref:Uncharacterized protein n=1 Tax=Catharanthus roseus TaxID=4058 RepID=A0ACB9ZY55_CATRO|nr:hypothetical protein M9H77_30061 [Catharanthus roseus]
MHNFYHGGGNGFPAYGGNNHGYGNFTPKRHNGVCNFSSYANCFEHTSYDDYGNYGRVNTRYDNFEHRVEDQGRSMEKELGTTLEDLSISLSLNPSLSCDEVSFGELKSLLSCFYAKESEFIEAIETGELVSLFYCKEELGGLSPMKEMEHQIEWFWEFLDLPPMVGPAPTVAARLPSGLDLVDNTLPRLAIVS